MERTLLCKSTWMKLVHCQYSLTKVVIFAAVLFLFPCRAYSNDVDTQESSTFAQQNQTVTGVVVDTSGEPVIGATVVENPTNGTITDIEGRFRIRATPESVLQISSLGYVSQQVTVGSQTSLRIILEDETQVVEEVVVVGYGVQKAVSVTAAVSTIQTKDLQQSSSASLTAALAGRLSGLSAVQNSGGQPGFDEATLMLRGAATINGRSPLIMIDGVPRESMNFLSPDEIASISVLKDASATAVFGVRGANGVIIINTRRGSLGRTELSVNVEQSWTSFTKEPERVHSLKFMELRNQALSNDGLAEMYRDIHFQKFANPLMGLDPNDPDYARQAEIRRYMYPDHFWYRETISKYTPSTKVNVNITGGTDKLQYFVNANYLHQGGNLNARSKSVNGFDSFSKMDRYSFRANLDYIVTNDLKVFLNLGSYIEQVNMPSATLYGGDTRWMITDLIYQATTMSPISVGPYTLAGIDDDVPGGELIHPTYMDRPPYEILNGYGSRNDLRSNLNATLGAEWNLKKLTEGLSIRGQATFDGRANHTLESYQRLPKYSANVNIDTDELSYTAVDNGESKLNYVKAIATRYSINLQASINYNRSFGKHNVGGMILGQRDHWEDGANLPYNIVSFAARATYDYDNRYLAEVNMGYNGSEQFSPSKRFGFFPAFSAGWVISNESFLRDSRAISNLKLRGSYGEVGNDQLGGLRFLYLDNVTMGGGNYMGGSFGTVNEGLLGNPNITWEIAKKQNYGIDIGLFREFTLSFDYFIVNQSDILISRGMVPALQGVSLGNIPKVNMGKVRNKGFEVELGYNKAISQDLLVSFKGNFGYNKNKQLFMDEPIRTEDYVYRYRNTGLPMGTTFGYKIDYSNGNGIFNSQEELDNYKNADGIPITYSFQSPRVGDFKYVDINGDGIIDDKDQVPIKYSNIPGITWGATLNLNWKWLDFMIFFQGVGRFSSYRGEQNVFERFGQGTYYPYHMKAWTKERYESGSKITYPALSTQPTSNMVPNDFFVMDRSFTRLKNIEIGYTLPEGTLRAIGISKFRIYASGQNLVTWSPQKATHLDPELDNPLGYPPVKILSLGAQLTF